MYKLAIVTVSLSLSLSLSLPSPLLGYVAVLLMALKLVVGNEQIIHNIIIYIHTIPSLSVTYTVIMSTVVLLSDAA